MHISPCRSMTRIGGRLVSIARRAPRAMLIRYEPARFRQGRHPAGRLSLCSPRCRRRRSRPSPTTRSPSSTCHKHFTAPVKIAVHRTAAIGQAVLRAHPLHRRRGSRHPHQGHGGFRPHPPPPRDPPLPRQGRARSRDPGGRRLHRQLQALRPGLLVPRRLRGAEPLRPAGPHRRASPPAN